MAFVLSNRGKQKLAENGYVYVKNKKSADGEEVFWNCEKRTSDKGKAIVHTSRHERDGSIYRLIRGLKLLCPITLVEAKLII